MQKKDLKIEKDISKENEIRKMANELVKCAGDNGYGVMKLCALIKECWHEYQSEPVVGKLLDVTDKGLKFRRKLERFVEDNAFDIRSEGKEIVEYECNGEMCYTNATIEFLYSMHEVYLDKVDLRDIIKVTSKRLKRLSENKFHTSVVANETYRDVNKFFNNLASDYWNKGLSEFCEQYIYKKRSLRQNILVMEWYLDNFY